MTLPFPDRRQAGEALAAALREYEDRSDVLVLALPRGGIEVAAPVARRLHAPLDVYLVRKLGAPMQPELAVGAIAEAGPGNPPVRIVDWPLATRLGLSDAGMEHIIARQEEELERRDRLYRAGRPQPDLANKSIILADDGAATGSTMLAAVRALDQRIGAEDHKLIVALPVASRDALKLLEREADEVVCLHAPQDFEAVGKWYVDFTQVEDETVKAILEEFNPDRV